MNFGRNKKSYISRDLAKKLKIFMIQHNFPVSIIIKTPNLNQFTLWASEIEKPKKNDESLHAR
jgi:hypothetical protein